MGPPPSELGLAIEFDAGGNASDVSVSICPDGEGGRCISHPELTESLRSYLREPPRIAEGDEALVCEALGSFASAGLKFRDARAPRAAAGTPILEGTSFLEQASSADMTRPAAAAAPFDDGAIVELDINVAGDMPLETCAICLNFLDHRTQRLRCGHQFCKQCLSSWLLRSNTCPTCRRALPFASPPRVRLFLRLLTASFGTAAVSMFVTDQLLYIFLGARMADAMGPWTLLAFRMQIWALSFAHLCQVMGRVDRQQGERLERIHQAARNRR